MKKKIDAEDYSFDTAIVGTTDDDRVVLDFDLMVDWLMVNKDITMLDAIELLQKDVLKRYRNRGTDAPIVMYRTINFKREEEMIRAAMNEQITL